jgi:hypothetical protein
MDRTFPFKICRVSVRDRVRDRVKVHTVKKKVFCMYRTFPFKICRVRDRDRVRDRVKVGVKIMDIELKRDRPYKDLCPTLLLILIKFKKYQHSKR